MKKGQRFIMIIVALLAVTPAARAVSANLAAALSESIADTVEKVMPSVVVVRTESMQYRLMRDGFFDHIYRIPERLAGMGSGVIIKTNGYILTNSHVIDGANEISVVLNDGTRYEAERVGMDPHTDLAVIRVLSEETVSFPAIAPGDSDALRVGEIVMALGSPFSLASSVTLGIVSQKERAIGLLPYEDFIQTDAAVNQGNSGGPLVDMEGRMVGVNTVIQTSGYSMGNIGISFAVPVNLAMRVANAIIDSGTWERPWLGILMQTLDDEEGIEIVEVVDDSPASHGGLRVGDFILSVDDHPVRTTREVQKRVLGREVGDAARVRVSRDGEDVELTIITEVMPSFPSRRGSWRE